MTEQRSFTTIASPRGLMNRLVNNVFIGPIFRPDDKPPLESDLHGYKALWDTGATTCLITEYAARESGLTVIGFTTLSTAGGIIGSSVYSMSLWLPSKVCITDLGAVQGILGVGIDLLIGMDVINQGDFAVNNLDGTTSFSFRMPSLERIDYTKRLTEPSRNQPCPCGSGKKYKNCHGRAK